MLNINLLTNGIYATCNSGYITLRYYTTCSETVLL